MDIFTYKDEQMECESSQGRLPHNPGAPTRTVINLSLLKEYYGVLYHLSFII